MHDILDFDSGKFIDRYYQVLNWSSQSLNLTFMAVVYFNSIVLFCSVLNEFFKFIYRIIIKLSHISFCNTFSYLFLDIFHILLY